MRTTAMWLACFTAIALAAAPTPAPTLERAAVIAGGPKGEAAVTAALTVLKAKLAPVLAELKEAEPEARAKRLLELVQYDFGRGALLKRYAPNAASLYDVIATGRFNAVSGAVLYYVAAREAGLQPAALLNGGDLAVRVGAEIARFEATPAITSEGEGTLITEAVLVALIFVQKATTDAALYQKAFDHALGDVAKQQIEQAVLAAVDKRIAGGDPAGAGAAIDVLLRRCGVGERCDALRALDADRLRKWSEKDGVAAAAAFFQRHGVGVFSEAARVIAKNHVLALTAERRCKEAQDAADAWSGMIEPGVADAPIETCFVDKSVELMRAKRYDVAAVELRSAMKTVKDDTRVRTTLVNAVSRQVMELLKQERCDDAKPWLEEGHALDPNESLFDQGIAYCQRAELH